MSFEKSKQIQLERFAQRDTTGVLITLEWDGINKLWQLVASIHGNERARVVSEKIHWTGAPDTDDLRRLVTAIRRECESWLW